MRRSAPGHQKVQQGGAPGDLCCWLQLAGGPEQKSLLYSLTLLQPEGVGFQLLICCPGRRGGGELAEAQNLER